MKISNFILLISFFLSVITYSQTGFCKGWEDGFKEGYCYGSYGCVPPLAPVCPVSNLGEADYKDGYNRGFLVGKAKKESNNSSGGAKGQLKPINNNYANGIRDYVRRENELKAERQLFKNQSLPYFNEALRKAVKAFEAEDYWECIKQYNNSKDLGWYDNKFELATGISYSILWMQDSEKSYLKMAKKLIKLSKKHGNSTASGLLKKLKEQEKQRKSL